MIRGLYTQRIHVSVSSRWVDITFNPLLDHKAFVRAARRLLGLLLVFRANHLGWHALYLVVELSAVSSFASRILLVTRRLPLLIAPPHAHPHAPAWELMRSVLGCGQGSNRMEASTSYN